MTGATGEALARQVRALGQQRVEGIGDGLTVGLAVGGHELAARVKAQLPAVVEALEELGAMVMPRSPSV